MCQLAQDFTYILIQLITVAELKPDAFSSYGNNKKSDSVLHY